MLLAGGERNGIYCLIGKFQFRTILEKVLEMGDGDSCIIM